jgi:hypothetical protein
MALEAWLRAFPRYMHEGHQGIATVSRISTRNTNARMSLNTGGKEFTMNYHTPDEWYDAWEAYITQA